MKLNLIFLILLAGTSRFTFAQSTFVGTGNNSCGKWAETREKKNEVQQALNEQWIAGFISAHNFYTKKKNVDFDLPTITLWIDGYCKSNPTHLVTHGAMKLIEELGGTKAPFPSK